MLQQYRSITYHTIDYGGTVTVQYKYVARIEYPGGDENLVDCEENENENTEPLWNAKHNWTDTFPKCES